MSRCVEKSFAPCWQCGRTRVFRPVSHRAVTARGERVFCYGRAEILSEQTECRSPVTGNRHSQCRDAAGEQSPLGNGCQAVAHGVNEHRSTSIFYHLCRVSDHLCTPTKLFLRKSRLRRANNNKYSYLCGIRQTLIYT